MVRAAIDISRTVIADFCRKHHIRKLSVFGSVLRDDFTDSSDVDFLVEFELGHTPGFLRLSAMERELSDKIGRQADLRTLRFFSPRYRSRIAQEAEVRYAAG